jgi:hypothetical protein
MPHCSYGSLSFTPPAAWRDHTLVTFVAPEGSGAGRSNIVVSRDAKLPGETLHALVHRRTTEESKLKGFGGLEVRPTTVGGRPAVRTSFRAARGAVVLECIVVYVEPPTGGDVVTITCSSGAGPARGWVTALEAMLATLTFDAAAEVEEAPEPEPDTSPVRLTPTPPPPMITAPRMPPPVPIPGLRARR